MNSSEIIPENVRFGFYNAFPPCHRKKIHTREMGISFDYVNEIVNHFNLEKYNEEEFIKGLSFTPKNYSDMCFCHPDLRTELHRFIEVGCRNRAAYHLTLNYCENHPNQEMCREAINKYLDWYTPGELDGECNDLVNYKFKEFIEKFPHLDPYNNIQNDLPMIEDGYIGNDLMEDLGLITIEIDLHYTLQQTFIDSLPSDNLNGKFKLEALKPLFALNNTPFNFKDEFRYILTYLAYKMYNNTIEQ